MNMSYGEKKVLVVEDSSVMRQIIIKNLKELGFKAENISEAENGTKGLIMAGKEKVNLIVSDWNMPSMNGLEFLKAVRTDSNLKDTVFMLVTSEADKEKVTEALKGGVSQYIVKPFNALQLEEKIKGLNF